MLINYETQKQAPLIDPSFSLKLPIMNEDSIGAGKPDGSTITVNEDGTMTASGGGGTGSTVSVTVGSTETTAAGTDAEVTNSGDTTNVVLNFKIPKGDTGAQGIQGPQGPAGQKGEKGEQGEQGPAGTAGAKGDKGDPGAQGPAGEGVPTGGTAGQVLTKVDGTNYNTQWSTLTIPSGDQLMTGTKSTIADSEATEATQLVTDFNALLAALRTRGIIS